MSVVFGSPEAQRIAAENRALFKHQERLDEIAELLPQYEDEIIDLEAEMRTLQFPDEVEDYEFLLAELRHYRDKERELIQERNQLLASGYYNLDED